MKNYYTLLGNNYKTDEEKAVGVAKLILLDDLVSQETKFFLFSTNDGFVREIQHIGEVLSITDECLEAIRNNKDDNMTTIIAIHNKSFGKKAGAFCFISKNDSSNNLMLFDIKPDMLKQLDKIDTIIGGDKMAKKCPLNGDYVLYLDCLECERKSECKRGELKNESSKK